MRPLNDFISFKSPPTTDGFYEKYFYNKHIFDKPLLSENMFYVGRFEKSLFLSSLIALLFRSK